MITLLFVSVFGLLSVPSSFHVMILVFLRELLSGPGVFRFLVSCSKTHMHTHTHQLKKYKQIANWQELLEKKIDSADQVCGTSMARVGVLETSHVWDFVYGVKKKRQ